MADIPYLLRGITQVPTESSTLVSSSRFLNAPALREWVGTELLRRNGPDLPTPSGAFRLGGIMRDIQDADAVNAMFAAERKRRPALDRWFSERFVSDFTEKDLADYPPESIAGIFHKAVVEGGYQIHIVPPQDPKTDWDYWRLRQGQTHDWEHIITHGGFDSIGEVSTGFARMENIYKFISPDLACELTCQQFFASFRFLSRTALHYPTVWHDMWDAVERGRRVGKASDAYLLARYEAVFHLTPAEAREALGVRGVEEVDTSRPSRAWDDVMPPVG